MPLKKKARGKLRPAGTGAAAAASAAASRAKLGPGMARRREPGSSSGSPERVRTTSKTKGARSSRRASPSPRKKKTAKQRGEREAATPKAAETPSPRKRRRVQREEPDAKFNDCTVRAGTLRKWKPLAASTREFVAQAIQSATAVALHAASGRGGAQTQIQETLEDARSMLTERLATSLAPMGPSGGAHKYTMLSEANSKLENRLLLTARQIKTLEGEVEARTRELDEEEDRLATFQTNMASAATRNKRTQRGKLHRLLKSDPPEHTTDVDMTTITFTPDDDKPGAEDGEDAAPVEEHRDPSVVKLGRRIAATLGGLEADARPMQEWLAVTQGTANAVSA